METGTNDINAEKQDSIVCHDIAECINDVSSTDFKIWFKHNECYDCK